MAPTPVTAIFGAGFTVAVSMALGFLLLGCLRLQFHRTEAALFAFVSGSACLSLGVFFLCLVHQARPVAFAFLGAAAIGSAVWQARKQPERAPLPEMPAVWRALFGVVLLAFFLCYLLNAMAPEVSPDGSGYHLGNVARYARNAGFAWDFHSIYASLSQGMEMLFLVAFSFGKHSAAALVEVAFQAALPLLMVCYGRRFGFPRAAAFAAILTFACPVVGIAGSSAYIDVSVATLLFAVFYLLHVWDEKRFINLLVLIGLLCGFCYALKYTAVLVLPFAIGFVWSGRAARRLPVLLLGAAILITPWVLRNWLWLGNPVAPFLNHWFPNPYWTDRMEGSYLSGLAHYPQMKSYFDIPLQLTVIGGLVPGLLGPVFLLAPISLLALRLPQGRRLLLAAAVFAIPALFNTEVRFLISSVPFVALAMALALANSWGVLPVLAIFHAVISWPGVINIYCDPNAWRIRGLPVRAALRLDPESTYIAAHIEDYALKPAIEQAVPPGGRIFSFAGRPAAYFDRDIIVGYESSLGQQVSQLLQHHATREVRALGIGYLWINDSDGLAAGMKSDPKSWSITQLAEANGTTFYQID
jgi:hypothetical protein